MIKKLSLSLLAIALLQETSLFQSSGKIVRHHKLKKRKKSTFSRKKIKMNFKKNHHKSKRKILTTKNKRLKRRLGEDNNYYPSFDKTPDINTLSEKKKNTLKDLTHELIQDMLKEKKKSSPQETAQEGDLKKYFSEYDKKNQEQQSILEKNMKDNLLVQQEQLSCFTQVAQLSKNLNKTLQDIQSGLEKFFLQRAEEVSFFKNLLGDLSNNLKNNLLVEDEESALEQSSNAESSSGSSSQGDEDLEEEKKNTNDNKKDASFLTPSFKEKQEDSLENKEKSLQDSQGVEEVDSQSDLEKDSQSSDKSQESEEQESEREDIQTEEGEDQEEGFESGESSEDENQSLQGQEQEEESKNEQKESQNLEQEDNEKNNENSENSLTKNNQNQHNSLIRDEAKDETTQEKTLPSEDQKEELQNPGDFSFSKENQDNKEVSSLGESAESEEGELEEEDGEGETSSNNSANNSANNTDSEGEDVAEGEEDLNENDESQVTESEEEALEESEEEEKEKIVYQDNESKILQEENIDPTDPKDPQGPSSPKNKKNPQEEKTFMTFSPNLLQDTSSEDWVSQENIQKTQEQEDSKEEKVLKDSDSDSENNSSSESSEKTNEASDSSNKSSSDLSDSDLSSSGSSSEDLEHSKKHKTSSNSSSSDIHKKDTNSITREDLKNLEKNYPDIFKTFMKKAQQEENNEKSEENTHNPNVNPEDNSGEIQNIINDLEKKENGETIKNQNIGIQNVVSQIITKQHVVLRKEDILNKKFRKEITQVFKSAFDSMNFEEKIQNFFKDLKRILKSKKTNHYDNIVDQLDKLDCPSSSSDSSQEDPSDSEEDSNCSDSDDVDSLSDSSCSDSSESSSSSHSDTCYLDDKENPFRDSSKNSTSSLWEESEAESQRQDEEQSPLNSSQEDNKEEYQKEDNDPQEDNSAPQSHDDNSRLQILSSQGLSQHVAPRLQGKDDEESDVLSEKKATSDSEDLENSSDVLSEVSDEDFPLSDVDSQEDDKNLEEDSSEEKEDSHQKEENIKNDSSEEEKSVAKDSQDALSENSSEDNKEDPQSNREEDFSRRNSEEDKTENKKNSSSSEQDVASDVQGHDEESQLSDEGEDVDSFLAEGEETDSLEDEEIKEEDERLIKEEDEALLKEGFESSDDDQKDVMKEEEDDYYNSKQYKRSSTEILTEKGREDSSSSSSSSSEDLRDHENFSFQQEEKSLDEKNLQEDILEEQEEDNALFQFLAQKEKMSKEERKLNHFLQKKCPNLISYLALGQGKIKKDFEHLDLMRQSIEEAEVLLDFDAFYDYDQDGNIYHQLTKKISSLKSTVEKLEEEKSKKEMEESRLRLTTDLSFTEPLPLCVGFEQAISDILNGGSLESYIINITSALLNNITYNDPVGSAVGLTSVVYNKLVTLSDAGGITNSNQAAFNARRFMTIARSIGRHIAFYKGFAQSNSFNQISPDQINHIISIVFGADIAATSSSDRPLEILKNTATVFSGKFSDSYIYDYINYGTSPTATLTLPTNSNAINALRSIVFSTARIIQAAITNASASNYARDMEKTGLNVQADALATGSSFVQGGFRLINIQTDPNVPGGKGSTLISEGNTIYTAGSNGGLPDNPAVNIYPQEIRGLANSAVLGVTVSNQITPIPVGDFTSAITPNNAQYQDPTILAVTSITNPIAVSTVANITGTVNTNISSVTGSLPVSGTVNVGTMPAITGTVDANVTGGTLGTVTTVGTVSAITGGTVNIGTMPTVTVTGTVGVSGTVPVSGTVGITGTVPISGNVGITGEPIDINITQVAGTAIAAGSPVPTTASITGPVTISAALLDVNIKQLGGSPMVPDMVYQPGADNPQYGIPAIPTSSYIGGAQAPWNYCLGNDGKLLTYATKKSNGASPTPTYENVHMPYHMPAYNICATNSGFLGELHTLDPGNENKNLIAEPLTAIEYTNLITKLPEYMEGKHAAVQSLPKGNSSGGTSTYMVALPDFY